MTYILIFGQFNLVKKLHGRTCWAKQEVFFQIFSKKFEFWFLWPTYTRINSVCSNLSHFKVVFFPRINCCVFGTIIFGQLNHAPLDDFVTKVARCWNATTNCLLTIKPLTGKRHLGIFLFCIVVVERKHGFTLKNLVGNL